MTACDRDTGRRLLIGELPDVEEAAFVQHLDQCEQCRAWLEREAGDRGDWQSARQLLAASSEVVSWRSTARAAGVGDETEVQLPFKGSLLARSSGVDLAILSPTDDPAFIGRIGGYEVSGVIGRGGMGVVFKAVDRPLNRNVAIKVLDPSLASIGAARQRFAREARAMAAISHEHVVPIYCVDQHQGLPYFAMEYVAGGTLESRLRLDGPLDTVSTVRIAIQVASALAAAHECGLVHRDIKPANILLDHGIERVRVADFGLARISTDASYTRSGLVAGTPQFMAPEQVRGEVCDARSDLFSLGSVMYAMCTGHPPFRAETVYGVMQRIVHDEPRGIREQCLQVPAWLEQFIHRLLAKDRQRRFDSAADVVRLLESELRYLQSPEQGVAPDRPWILVAGAGRARWGSRALAAGVVLICIGLAALAWQLGNDAGPQQVDDAGGSAASAAAQGSTAELLWDQDGMQQTRYRARLLELELHTESPSGELDPWTSDVRSLRQRLEEAAARSP
jgi:serine/threonine-protein kinase